MLSETQRLLFSIADDLKSMCDDELHVVAHFTAGIVKGRNLYGPLDIDTDGRDFLEEAQEEGRDRSFYMGAELVRLRRFQVAVRRGLDKIKDES